MKRALVAGTYDPITLGHMDVIERAAGIFDEVIVMVGYNVKKNTLFTVEERVALVEESVKDLPNVKVASHNGLLVDFAKEQGCTAIVKGLRAITDFEYEFQMTAMNYNLEPSVETVFIMSPPEYMYLSSSIVRELASFHADYERFVTPCVKAALEAKFA